MKRTLFLLLALLPMLVQAQRLSDYTVSVSTGGWNSIAQTGTQLSSVVGDYGFQTVALPFDFSFGLSDFPAGSNVCVRCDGFIKLRGVCSSGSHDALAYWDNGSTAVISPFMLFDGQMPDSTSGCWYQVMPDGNGNQMLVIEWRQVQHYPMYPISIAEAAQDDFNYQLRLHSNGDISCVYGYMHNGVSNDTLFNFFLADGSTYSYWEYLPGYYTMERDHVALRGTWDSVLTHTQMPGYRRDNNNIVFPSWNLLGCPALGTTITWHRPAVACPHPTDIAVGQVTHNSALLSWTSNGVAGAQMEVQYDTVDFFLYVPDTTPHSSLYFSGDSALLTDLEPNQHYWLRMRSACGSDSSYWRSVQFQTPCTPVMLSELPITENFESITPNDQSAEFPPCWAKSYNCRVSDISSLEGHQNQVLQLSNNGNIHLPPVEDVYPTVLTFRARYRQTTSSSLHATLQVGVLEDPFDANSFTEVQSFTVRHTDWQEYSVPFAPYSGNGNTVALKWNTSNLIYVDDLELSYFDGCLPAESVSVSTIGQHSATVSWNLYLPADSCRMVWYANGNELLADSLTVTTSQVVLNNLVPGMEYTVKVYVLCGNGEVGEPVTTTFRTRCALPLPMDEDFNGLATLPNCWLATSMKYPSYGSSSYVPAVPTVENGSVKFSSMYTSSSNYERGILLLPIVDTVVNRLRLTFDYRVERFPELMSLMVGVIPGDDDIENYLPIETIYPADTLWHHYSVETGAVPISEGRLVLMQHSTGDHEYVQYYWRDLGHLDNVHIEALPACDRPAAVWVTNIGSSSARVHWMENNGVGTYHVACGDTVYTVTGTTELLVAGLTPAQEYTVAVSRQCDTSYTDVRNATFRTACSVDLPWMENFDTWSYNQIGPCWLRYEAGTSSDSRVGAISGSYLEPTSGDHVLNIQASNYIVDPMPYDAIAVLPEVAVPLGGVAIGFNVRFYSGTSFPGMLELGVMDDADDSTTFRVLDTVPLSSSWSYYEHQFAAADSGRIALRLKSFSSLQHIYIDDIALFTATDCHRPDAVTVTAITQHTVDVAITDSVPAGSYRLYWQSQDGGAVNSMDINAMNATIGELSSNTAYVIRAAALCDGGTHLSNVVLTDFRTLCDTLTRADMPYAEDFEGYDFRSAGSPCWTMLPGNGPKVDTNHINGNSDNILSMWPNNGPYYAILPNIDTVANVNITFWATTLHTGSSVTVGVMEGENTNTFQPVQTIMASNNVWTQYQVQMTGYQGTSHRIAFRVDTIDSFTNIYLDDIMVDIAVGCARPDSVLVSNVADRSAELTIVDSAAVGNYHIVVSSYADTIDMLLNGTQYTLTNLEPATDYEVHVSAVCPDGGETFYCTATFITDCGIYSLPYSEDFENMPLQQSPRCWQTNLEDYRLNVFTHTWDNTRVLGGSIVEEEPWRDMVTPELNIDGEPFGVSFNVKAQQYYSPTGVSGNRYDTRLQVYLEGEITVLVYDDTIAFNNSGYQSIDGRIQYVEDDWRVVAFNVPALPLTNARLRLRFWREAEVAAWGLVRLDNLLVGDTLSCSVVDTLWIEEVGTTYADVAWQPTGDENAWHVHLYNADDDRMYSVETPQIEFVDLLPGTIYTVSVQAVYDRTEGEWSEPLTFVTDEDSTMSIVDLPATSNIIVYPNPTRGSVTVQGVDGNVEVVAYDLKGRRCGEWHVHGGEPIALNSLPAGIYYLHLTAGKVSKIEKVVKVF